MLRVRWLGRVRFQDAHAVQQALFERGAAAGDHLLLLEHPHVFTMGLRASPEHVLVPPTSVGAELVATNRGGDVTYHGPGQLVGYPILSVPNGPGATPSYVRSVEQLVIDVCGDLGLPDVGRLDGYPGVWVEPGGTDPRKVCAIGVRRSRGRTMHGFALNVDPDLSFFDHIVPCGIPDKEVTSLAAEGVRVTMREVVDAVVARAGEQWGGGEVERQDVAWHVRPEDLSAFSRGDGTVPVRLLGRLAEAGVDPASGLAVDERKPSWLRVKADLGPRYREVRSTMRSLDLVTVCEEAGCPNIFECWADGTATFMINGERCTRACGFCLVDTRHPEALDPGEPEHVAEAVARMGLAHAVVTAVARDDLPDGGAAAFAATIRAVRSRCPATAVEVLVPDFGGRPDALATVFGARPDVLNHNLETVARLQRAVRPQASYTRSLAVLARAGTAGLTTKSGIILGMGETEEEVLGAMADLRNVGVELLTLGQYLRPTDRHLPVARWWHPDEFAELATAG
ncbi:MAG TPA: lipoyl(octanoyl) transferase LipB, partial [Acidimicrobiales bacterium]|nr:lipoyl(octanoyl) transferase LipB [Acidimicrobiales bacterium]